jgi:hypothetical protein
MISAEDIERQVAVTVVVAVEEPPLLLPMQGYIGGIYVQHDLRAAVNSSSMAAAEY